MIDPTKQVIFMSWTDQSPPGQYHLPNGVTLHPIGSAGPNISNGVSDGLISNMFAVPIAFRSLAQQAGFEAQSDIQNRVPQGPTSARPSAPASGDRFWDQTLGRLIVWSVAQNAWTSVTAWTP